MEWNATQCSFTLDSSLERIIDTDDLSKSPFAHEDDCFTEVLKDSVVYHMGVQDYYRRACRMYDDLFGQLSADRDGFSLEMERLSIEGMKFQWLEEILQFYVTELIGHIDEREAAKVRRDASPSSTIVEEPSSPPGTFPEYLNGDLFIDPLELSFETQSYVPDQY